MAYPTGLPAVLVSMASGAAAVSSCTRTAVLFVLQVLISPAIGIPAQQIMPLSFRFQEVYHPESTYLEKPPTAQLTRVDAADRLFSVSLTRITSVPECAVSSVGFLWGSAAVSLSCGVSVGLAEAPDRAGRPGTGTQVPPTSGS
jgi:hypothetical protein